MISNGYLQCDWLAFTCPYDTESDLPMLDQFFNLFPEVRDYVMNSCANAHDMKSRHYQRGFSLGDLIFIYYDTEYINRGVNVQICSSGLRTWFDLFGMPKDSIFPMLLLLDDRGCKVSRIDLCYDDFSKTFRPKDYAHALIEGRLQTRYRDFNFVGSGKDVGWTFYLGSRRSSKTIFRCYDKDIESGKELDSVRYEWEFHSDKARSIVDYILNKNTSLEMDCISFSGFMKHFMRVLVSNDCQQKDKVATLPKWEEFLVEVDNCLNNSHFANSSESTSSRFARVKEILIPQEEEKPITQDRIIKRFCQLVKEVKPMYHKIGSDMFFGLLEDSEAVTSNHSLKLAVLKQMEILDKEKFYKDLLKQIDD